MRLTEGFDDLDAVDIFHGSIIENFCLIYGILIAFLIATGHEGIAAKTNRNRCQYRQRHPPIQNKQIHQKSDRHQQIGCKLRYDMCHSRFDAVNTLHQYIFDGAGGDVQHRAQRHTGEFRADPLAYGAQHSEGCFMRECGGNAMKSAVPQPQDCHNKTVFYVYAHVPASTQEI